MKKILQFKMMRSLLLIVIAVMGFSSSGWADPTVTKEDGICYSDDGTNAKVDSVEYTFLGSDFLTIKGTVNGKPVTSISADAFKGCNYLTDIIVPASVTAIDATAFSSAPALKALFLQSAIVPTFTNGTLPSGCVVYVPYENMSSYTGWVSNDISESMLGKTFNDASFNYVVINSHEAYITGVQHNAELTYYLPTTTVNYNNSNYTVSGIKAAAFDAADNMKSIVIPSNIKTIEAGAFTGAAALKYVKFDGILPILKGVGFPTLDQIVIDCSSVSYPPSFNNTDVPLATGESNYVSISSNLTDFVKKYLTDASVYGTKVRTITTTGKGRIGFDVITLNGINYWVHYSMVTEGIEIDFPAEQVSKLKAVTIPTGVGQIVVNCFNGYNNITSITLNSDLSYIGNGAFATGKKLANMTIPAKVTRICTPLFDGTSIPDTLVMLSSTPPAIMTTYNSAIAPSMPIANKYLMVPSGTTAAYKSYKGDEETNTACVWGIYSEANVIEEEFTSDDFVYTYTANKAGLSLKKVATASLGKTSFIIPETVNGKNVTEIADGAFSAVTGSGVIYAQLPKTIAKGTTPFTGKSVILYFKAKASEVPEGFSFSLGANNAQVTAVTAITNSFEAFSEKAPGDNGSYFYQSPYWYEITGDKTAALIRPNDLAADSYKIPTTATEDVSGKSYTISEIGLPGFSACTSSKFTSISIPATVTSLNSASLTKADLLRVTLEHASTSTLPEVSGATSPFASNVKVYVSKGVKTLLLNGGDSWAGVEKANIFEDGDVSTIFSDGTFWYTVKKYDAANWDYEVVLDSLVSKTATAYTIPDSVKYATADTYKYKVTEIGASAFAGITKALTIVIPSTVQAIDAKAFDTDNYPKYVVLPKTPATGMTIAADAFKSKVLFYTEATKPVAGWDNIKGYEITVPTGTLDAYTGFTKAKVLGDENSIYSEGGVWYQVYSATNTQAAAINPVDMGSKDLTIATKIIKDNFIVDKIAEKAFSNSALTSIKLGDSLKIIGDSAFWFTYITKISLPASVDSIGSSALRTSSTSGSTLALTDITVNNDTPCKWHAGDTYLPKNGVKLHVSSTTVKNAYMSKGWEGYTSTYESLIIPTKDETLVEDLVKGSDVTIVDGSNFHIGTSSVNYAYTSNTFAGYSPKSITVMDAITKLTLSKDTVSGTVTVSNDKSDKAGLTLTISNSKLGGITNNDTVTIIADSKSSLGTITNNGVLVEESGVISKIDAGKTQMSVAGDINKSFPGNSSTKIFASATVLKGSAKADSVQFVWQLKDAKSVYQTIAKGTHYALAKKSGLRAAATKTLIDSLTVTEGGDYRCLITDFDSTKTAYATLGVYGTVTTTTPKTVGVITLKAFKKGYYKGVSYGKDSTFVFTKDTSFEFQIMDTLDYLIKNYAVVTATYKSTGEKDTLTADINFFYKILHTDDTITVSVDSCIITANEPISLTNNVKVWGNDGILHVSAPQRVTVYIATFDGRMRAVTSEAGDQEFYLGKGIYIIRIEDKTWKIKI